jgi:vitamin B12 transporter
VKAAFGWRIRFPDARSPESEHPVVFERPHIRGRATACPFIAKMKSQEITAATLVRGLFNSRALRAASLLSVFGTGSLLAAETSAQPVEPVKAPVVAKAESAEPTQTIEPTVVIASRHEEKLADVSPSVSVIDAEKIRNNGFHQISDALVGQQGMFPAINGAAGSQTSVFTRGNSSKSTTFMLDGRRLNAGFSGSYEIQRYSTANLNSIQIDRSASATLYTSTLGGAVDLRSVDPLAVKQNGGFAEVEAGSFSTLRTSAQVAGNTDNLSDSTLIKGLGASAGVSFLDTQNDRLNNDFRQVSVLPRIDYKISDTLRTDLVMQYSADKLGLPGGDTTPASGVYNPVDFQRDESFLVSPGFSFKTDESLSGRVFFSSANNRSTGFNFGAPFLYEDDKQEFTGYADYSPEKHVSLNLGYTLENTYYHSTVVSAPPFGSPSGSILSNSPWARLSLFPIEDLTVGGGVRYNAYDEFKDKVTWETFSSYRVEPTGTTVHTKVSSTYRAPAPTDFAFGTVGKLRPEEAVSYEVGLRQELFSKKVNLGAVVYDNEIEDLIGFDSVTFATYNIDRARTRGVEIFGDWTPDSHVKLFANADYTDARSLTNTAFGEQAGERLRRRPQWTATAGLEVYPVKTVTFGFSATAVNGREDFDFTGFTKVDLGNYILGRVYAKWAFCENAEIFGRVENLFDETYEPASIGFNGLPLGAYAGLRVRF